MYFRRPRIAPGWRITARCIWGKREGMKSKRECHYTRELDMETLVWTRRPNFPLSSLHGGSSDAGRGEWSRCFSRPRFLI